MATIIAMSAFRRRVYVLQAILAVYSMAVVAKSSAQIVERIEVPGMSDGVSAHSFLSGQRLSDLPFADLVSYEGGWRNGLAHGEGIIYFPNTQNTGYLSETSPGKPNYYIGTFVDGRPLGDGTLVNNSSLYSQNLTGIFSNRILSYSIGGRELSVITYVAGKKRLLLRAMQYAVWNQQQPSRMFLGEISTQGAPKGDWIDIPWFIEDGEVTVVGFGRVLEQHHKDGSKSSCIFEPRAPDRPKLVEDLVGFSGNIAAQQFASFDSQYSSKANCISTNPKGWTWTVDLDYTTMPAKVTYTGCKTPSGKTGKLKDNGAWCEEKKKANQDVFTNLAKEFKRFVDRRVLGSLDKIGGSMEKAMCRATGTEPGRNCSISVTVGTSWPVGDGAASGLSIEEQAVRNTYIAASKRASALPGALAGTPEGDVISMAADFNAICIALCYSEAQRNYSAALLSDLEHITNQPRNDETVRSVASIQRETASVLSAGLRSTAIVSTVAVPVVAWYRFGKSLEQAGTIVDAMEAVRQARPGSNFFEFERQRANATKVLIALKMTNLNSMFIDGANILGAAIITNIRILRGFPPQRVRALTAAILIGKTKAQVEDFIMKYKDVKSEEELNQAIIKEALAPMGVAWPQK